MEQNEIGLERPVVEGGITLIPVVKTVRFKVQGSGGASVILRKKPAALIVLKAETYKIFSDEWVEISLEDFERAFPGMSNTFSNRVSREQTDV